MRITEEDSKIKIAITEKEYSGIFDRSIDEPYVSRDGSFLIGLHPSPRARKSSHICRGLYNGLIVYLIRNETFPCRLDINDHGLYPNHASVPWNTVTVSIEYQNEK